MVWICDLDGVVYRGKTVLPGAKAALRALTERGDRVCYLSNNSTLSRLRFQERLAGMGIETTLDQLFPSSYLAARYFAAMTYPQERRVLLIGEAGLREEVAATGIQLVDDPRLATDVLVGMDRSCTYDTICRGHRAVIRGADLIATNADATYPVESETIPGAGVLVRALEVSTGARALVLGKPHPAGIELIMEATGVADPGDVAIVGDRLETDIAAGKSAGIRTVLVLSGISTREEVERLPTKARPDHILTSLADVVSLDVSADKTVVGRPLD